LRVVLIIDERSTPFLLPHIFNYLSAAPLPLIHPVYSANAFLAIHALAADPIPNASRQ
jgi:hypothetical protein